MPFFDGSEIGLVDLDSKRNHSYVGSNLALGD